MLLRPRQKIFVENCVAALKQRRNTLGVAPTGAGKTIMLSAATGDILRETGGKAAILAHRDELTAQNVTKFARVNPSLSTSIYDANSKSWHGRATFAMVPTLARQDNLSRMPHLDLLVIDEAHHAAAASYLRIIEEAKGRQREMVRHLLPRATRLWLHASLDQTTQQTCTAVLQHALPRSLRTSF